GDLYLEQLANGVVLAAPFIDPTRRFEEAREVVRVHARIGLHVLTQRLPRLAAIGIVLQQPEGALDRIRAHPSPGGHDAPRRQRECSRGQTKAGKRELREILRGNRLPRALPCYGGYFAIARAAGSA